MDVNEIGPGGALAERVAPVISLDRRRRVRDAADRAAKRAGAPPPKAVVAIWLGAAIFSVLVIVGVVVSSAIKHGPAGLAVLFAVSVVAGSPLAVRWLRGTQRTPSPMDAPRGGARRTIFASFRAPS